MATALNLYKIPLSVVRVCVKIGVEAFIDFNSESRGSDLYYGR